MGRIVFWLAVGVALYLAWRWWRRKALRDARGPVAEAAVPTAEPMLACRVCGLNVPASEVVRADTRTYCCEEHRAAGEGRN